MADSFISLGRDSDHHVDGECLDDAFGRVDDEWVEVVVDEGNLWQQRDGRLHHQVDNHQVVSDGQGDQQLFKVAVGLLSKSIE